MVGPAGRTRVSSRRGGLRGGGGGASERGGRLAAWDVVDGPVPPPDRAVVHPQLGEPRDVAPVEDGARVLGVADRQQRREVLDVLLEVVEDRGDPALTEPHPRTHTLRLQLLWPGVGCLLEQRDAVLAPQLLAEQERRVRTERD